MGAPFHTVHALAVYENELIAGGGFTNAGGAVSAYWARWGASCPPGDLNCDGRIDALDVPAFVGGLLDPRLLDDCTRLVADVNGDGLNDGNDAQAFVALLLDA